MSDTTDPRTGGQNLTADEPAADETATQTAEQAGEQPDAQAPETPQRPRRVWAHLIRGTLGTALAIVCIYSLVCAWTLHSAAQAYKESDYDETVRLSQLFEKISIFEHHKPPFNIGTVAAAEARYDDAQPLLERALDLTPVSDECAVRINLAYVFEKQAEEFKGSEKTDEANEKFDLARTTLQEAPDECRPDGSSTDQQMDESEKRIDESQKEMNNPGDGGDGDDSDGDGSGGDDGDKDGDGTDGDDDGGGGGEDTGDDGPGGSGGDQTGQESEAERKQRELNERNREADQRQQDDQDDRGENNNSNTKPW